MQLQLGFRITLSIVSIALLSYYGWRMRHTFTWPPGGLLSGGTYEQRWLLLLLCTLVLYNRAPLLTALLLC